MNPAAGGPVAIIGVGSVGRALGGRLAETGIEVIYGARDPSAQGQLPGGPVVTPREALASAGITFLAVPAPAAVIALEEAGGPGEGIVVDCTNPVRWDSGPVWDPPSEGSVAARIAAAFPAARVVKGFNHFGAEVMERPLVELDARRSQGAGTVRPGATPTRAVPALFAGDDVEARRRVMRLAGQMGFAARDAGPLRNAGLLENLAILWIHLATVGGVGRTFAFDLVDVDAEGT